MFLFEFIGVKMLVVGFIKLEFIRDIFSLLRTLKPRKRDCILFIKYIKCLLRENFRSIIVRLNDKYFFYLVLGIFRGLFRIFLLLEIGHIYNNFPFFLKHRNIFYFYIISIIINNN